MKAESNPVKPCTPECRTKFDARRAEGSRYYTIHSPHCQSGCSDPLPNPVDEANAPGAAEVKCACGHPESDHESVEYRGTLKSRSCAKNRVGLPRELKCPCESFSPIQPGEGEIDFESAERSMRFAADRSPNSTMAVGSNEGRAYLSLAAKVTELEAEVARLKAMLPPGGRDAGGPFVCEGSWSVFAEKVVAERDTLTQALTVANARVESLESKIVAWYESDECDDMREMPCTETLMDEYASCLKARAAREREKGENRGRMTDLFSIDRLDRRQESR